MHDVITLQELDFSFITTSPNVHLSFVLMCYSLTKQNLFSKRFSDEYGHFLVLINSASNHAF